MMRFSGTASASLTLASWQCIPQHLGARCVIKLDFIDFQLALGEQHNRGPWETADGVGGSGVCAGRDRIQVSPHGSFHKGHFV
ncbi:hypothetical protein E2C01_087956 [Portunus trituberculatus]|uniref:Uncharacterized protein n=1 Tax=Portunus trituberculatus TaxID=210409 RepID=A0A5B7JE34_PORTR|nr:hypothetical protein [Portunus trituberculatus]